MRPNYTLARLYVPMAFCEGSDIVLPKEQAHYIATVLRKTAGQDVRIFNAECGEHLAQIGEASRKSVSLNVKQQLRAPVSVPDIWLLFAPVKRARSEFIIEKATELGAARIQPVITARTQFPKLRIDRMQLQVIEAAEQTERLDIPDISEAKKLTDILQGWDQSRRLIFADEALAHESQALDSVCDALQNVDGPAAILIGPEGGFDPKEREHLRALPFVLPVHLGPRILRADTAAVSLLTLWQSIQGDWSR